MVLHGSKASSSRKKWLSFVSLFYGLSTIEDNDSQIILTACCDLTFDEGWLLLVLVVDAVFAIQGRMRTVHGVLKVTLILCFGSIIDSTILSPFTLSSSIHIIRLSATPIMNAILDVSYAIYRSH